MITSLENRLKKLELSKGGDGFCICQPPTVRIIAYYPDREQRPESGPGLCPHCDRQVRVEFIRVVYDDAPQQEELINDLISPDNHL